MANEFVSFEKLKLFLENIKTKIISPLSIRISSLEKSHGGGGTSSSFKPRSDESQNRPDIAKDKYWKCVGFGDGINTFPNIHEDYSNVPNGSALPNCTGYAQGRLFEIIDQTDAEEYVVFTRGNAEQIYDQYSENQRGQIPKLGAVMCWKNRGDGYGHVAIVEVMNKVGDHYQIIASESMYPRDESQIKDRWYMVRTYEYSNGGYYNSMVPNSVYEFQGFVYAVTIPEAPIQDLATVAYTGEYSDLLNPPIIPDEQINSDWNQTDPTKKDFIKNKPVIPAAQMNSDWNATSGKAQILNKPTSLSDFEDDVVSGNYLPLTGGQVNGVVQLGGTSPAIEFLNGYGEINGYSGAGTPFHNMKNPIDLKDGANKEYVDNGDEWQSAKGEIGYSDTCSAYAAIIYRKHGNNKIDISCRFTVNDVTTATSNHIFDIGKVCALIGVNSITTTTNTTRISAFSSADGHALGTGTYSGYGGFSLEKSSSNTWRIYRWNNTTLTGGGAWAISSIINSPYKFYGTFDIYGATYT